MRGPEVAEPPVEDYEQVVYPGGAYHQTHPDHLATVGRLFGLRPTPVGKARVLEVGCANGENLVPLACQLPEATFVGVELSPTQAANARRWCARLGLANVEIVEGDLCALPAGRLGSFDYVIAHGFFSWVPERVQEGFLARCAESLTADGIAYVSYNALPGWASHLTGRALMRHRLRHVDGAHGPSRADSLSRADGPSRADVAVAFLRTVSEHAIGVGDGTAWGPIMANYAEMLALQERHLAGQPHQVLLHDQLATYNEPFYLQDFVGRAARHGLQYLADADLADATLNRLDPQIRAQLEALCADPVEFEQYLDFFSNRTFRRSLLCRAERALTRPPSAAAVHDLLLSSAMVEVEADEHARRDGGEGVARFVSPEGAECLTADPVLQALYRRLIEVFPAAVPFGELAATARERAGERARVGTGSGSVATDAQADALLAAEMLRSYLAGWGTVEFRTSPVPATGRVSERPRAHLLARLMAASGAPALVSQRHQQVGVDHEIRSLVALLDGTRDVAALDLALQQQGASSPERVHAMLETLARCALLVE